MIIDKNHDFIFLIGGGVVIYDSGTIMIDEKRVVWK
jgi:hypothetical protein